MDDREKKGSAFAHMDDAVVKALSDLIALATAERGSSPRLKPYMMVPDGYAVKDLSSQSLDVQRKSGVVRLHTVRSFAHYVNKHYQPSQTVVYADESSVSLTAVINDHGGSGDHYDLPDFGDFRAIYACPLSTQWRVWQPLHRTCLPQAKFLDHLEDHSLDVTAPIGADLFSVIKDVRGKSDAAWKSAVNLTNGEYELHYAEKITAETSRPDKMVVPERIVLTIPIFQDGEPREIPCRLRFRVESGALAFQLIMDRYEQILQEEFSKIIYQLVGSPNDTGETSGLLNTGVSLLMGTATPMAGVTVR